MKVDDFSFISVTIVRFKMLAQTKEYRKLYLYPTHKTIKPIQIRHKKIGCQWAAYTKDPMSVIEDLDVAVILVGSNDLLNAGTYIDQWSEASFGWDLWPVDSSKDLLAPSQIVI